MSTRTMLAFALTVLVSFTACKTNPSVKPSVSTPKSDAVEKVELTPALLLQSAKAGFEADPRKGVAVTMAVDPPFDIAQPRHSRLACGRALQPLLDDVTRYVVSRGDGPEWEGDDFGPTCSGATCKVPSLGEYTSSATLTFDGVGEKIYLRSVSFVEGGPISPEFVDSANTWAAAEHQKLQTIDCGSGDPMVNRGLFQVCNTAAQKEPGLLMKEEPDWSEDVLTLRTGAQMLDGLLLEDLKQTSEDGQWQAVAVVGEWGERGWVPRFKRDSAKVPVLCPVPGE